MATSGTKPSHPGLPGHDRITALFGRPFHAHAGHGGEAPAAGATAQITRPVTSVLDQGAAFDAATQGVPSGLPYRDELEQRFGEPLDDIQVFLGRATALEPLGAEAATRGRRVAFADAAPSVEVVAHEAAHTLQHRRGGAERNGRIAAHGDASELAADAAARDVVAGRHASAGAPGEAGINLKPGRITRPLPQVPDGAQVELTGATRTGGDGNPPQTEIVYQGVTMWVPSDAVSEQVAAEDPHGQTASTEAVGPQVTHMEIVPLTLVPDDHLQAILGALQQVQPPVPNMGSSGNHSNSPLAQDRGGGLEHEVFSLRIPQWNTGCGDQEAYGKSCLSAVNEAVSRLEQLGGPQKLLDFLAAKRRDIAVSAGDEKAQEYGQARTKDSVDQDWTPIAGRYSWYADRVFGASITTEPGSDCVNHDPTTTGLCSIHDETRTSQFVQYTTSVYIDDPVVLTTTKLHFDHKEIESNWKGRNKESAPGYWEHTKPSSIKLVLPKAMELCQRALSEAMPLKELQALVAEIHWLMVQLMPYTRGSAAIADMLTKVIWAHHRVRVYRWKEGIAPDLEAFVRPLHEFVASYGSFFEKPPENKT